MRSNILQFVLITAIRLGECIGYLIIIIVVEIFPMETRYPGLVIKFQPHHYITEGVLNVLIEKMATLWSPQTGCSSSPSPSREIGLAASQVCYSQMIRYHPAFYARCPGLLGSTTKCLILRVVHSMSRSCTPAV